MSVALSVGLAIVDLSAAGAFVWLLYHRGSPAHLAELGAVMTSSLALLALIYARAFVPVEFTEEPRDDGVPW